jgi:hypothetical protein
MATRLKITIFSLFVGIISLFPVLSHAQVPAISLDGVQITLYPDLPAPGQNVTIEVTSYSTDLSSASIVWIVDGKRFAEGVGKTKVLIASPALGKTSTVIADIMTVEKREVKKAVTLQSGSVDLIWEGQGYVPPFYKGRAGFVFQNQVRLTAIPHLAGPNGTELPPNSLVYKWTNNDKVIQDQSGYGKQTIVLQDDVPQTWSLTVEVSTPTGTQKAISSIDLEPDDPSILFYEDDPLYGVLYNKAMTDKLSLTTQEISLRAVPFLFSFSKSTPLKYNWTVNNLERPDLSTNESITLRTKGDVEGSSDISLDIRNQDQILQGARGGVSVYFNKRQTDTSDTATFQ